MGNLGNRLFQWMVARAVGQRVEGAAYSAIDLAPFGIVHPPLSGEFSTTEIVTTPAVPLDHLAFILAQGAVQRVDIRTYGQRVENLLPPQAYRDLLPVLPPEAEDARPDEILCNIRQGDILDGHHPDYVLLPPEFYQDIVALTGLAPVFMGQIENSPYMRRLKRMFPQARFVASRGARADFDRIRRARHIVPAISTFSWLAAWLSWAEEIHLPVLGLFNPAQNRTGNFLPLEDPRFRFHLFPVHYACPVARSQAAHAAIHRLWRLMPADRMAAFLSRTPPPRQKHLYSDMFDEAYYRSVHPDIAAAIACGDLPDGRHHYDRSGFDEGRSAFPLDRHWYCCTYPVAAMEIAAGDFWDTDQHWLEMGRARGYRRAAAA